MGNGDGWSRRSICNFRKDLGLILHFSFTFNLVFFFKIYLKIDKSIILHGQNDRGQVLLNLRKVEGVRCLKKVGIGLVTFHKN